MGGVESRLLLTVLATEITLSVIFFFFSGHLMGVDVAVADADPDPAGVMVAFLLPAYADADDGILFSASIDSSRRDSSSELNADAL